MQILVDHLTRMSSGFICVAGLGDDGRHVRPVISPNQLPSSLLGRNGGPFSLGAVVDLGDTTPVGTAPEVEDHRFEPGQARLVSMADRYQAWPRLFDSAELSLTDIFGHDLARDGKGASVRLGAGRGSLGTLDPGYRPRLQARGDKVRCIVVDPDLGELNLSVTDVGFHIESDGRWIPNHEAVEKAESELKGGRPVLLSVGLTRPWPSDRPRHWLQVNSIHLEPDSSEQNQPPAYDLELIRREHPNAYRPWNDADEELLKLLHARNQSFELMAAALGRQLGGIKSRLRRLGLIE